MPLAPGTVGNTDFNNGIALLSGLREHLRIHEKAVGGDFKPLQCFPTKHLERTIDIADLRSDERSHEYVVHPRIKATQRRILTVDAVATDDVVLLCEEYEAVDLTEVKLHVCVCENNQVAPGSGETRPKRRAVTLILFVPQYAQRSVFLLQRF